MGWQEILVTGGVIFGSLAFFSILFFLIKSPYSLTFERRTFDFLDEIEESGWKGRVPADMVAAWCAVLTSKIDPWSPGRKMEDYVAIGTQDAVLAHAEAVVWLESNGYKISPTAYSIYGTRRQLNEGDFNDLINQVRFGAKGDIDTQLLESVIPVTYPTSHPGNAFKARSLA